MTDTNCKVCDQYSVVGLTDRIKAALATATLETEALTVAQLAPLDEFHTRGTLGAAELARAARLDAFARVLDLDCRSAARRATGRSVMPLGQFFVENSEMKASPKGDKP